MRLAAEKLGLRFMEKDLAGLRPQLAGFDLFKKAANRLFSTGFHGKGKISAIAHAERGNVKLYLFDFTYLVPTGKSNREVRQTVFFADSKQWYLPDFRLQPETWWHKILNRLGLRNDIAFPESPSFSDHFWITGQHEDQLRRTFSKAVQELILDRPPIHVEGSNYYLIAYKPGKAMNADEAERFFLQCTRLVEGLQQEGGQPELLELAALKEKEELAPPPAAETIRLEEKRGE